MSSPDGEQTFYEAIGGAATIERVVHRFYQGVASDPLLRAIYPEDDLGPAEDRFTKFLIQYWGGPTTYSQERGHPRLRMRHAPFAVTARGARALAAALPCRARRGGAAADAGRAVLGLRRAGVADDDQHPRRRRTRRCR